MLYTLEHVTNLVVDEAAVDDALDLSGSEDFLVLFWQKLLLLGPSSVVGVVKLLLCITVIKLGSESFVGESLTCRGLCRGKHQRLSKSQEWIKRTIDLQKQMSYVTTRLKGGRSRFHR